MRKRLKLKDFDDKTKLLISVFTTAAVFVVCALIPLFVKVREEATPGLSYGERAAVFSAYWNDKDPNVKMRSVTSPGKSAENFSSGRAQQLLQECFIDRQELQLDTQGSEFFTLTYEDKTVNICRKWEQCQGDWRNWIDMCFDADSGEVYYLYISCECLKNSTLYRGLLSDEVDTEYVAGKLGEKSGYELLYLDWSGNSEDNGTALYMKGSDALRFRVSCIYYDATLIDIKICCDI